MRKIKNFFKKNPLFAGSITVGFLYLIYKYRFRIEKVILPPGSWLNPVIGPVTSKFGNRVAPIAGASTFHQGVDIGVPHGTNVICPRDGEIHDFTQWNDNGLAQTRIIIKHDNGFLTGYDHLSTFNVSDIGAKISKGMIFAQTGTGGTGPHLHFSVTDKSGKKIDPQTIFSFKKETNVKF